MHVVLVEPEIPQNTGNIARTCVLTKSVLHLIKPLGFSLSDKYLKRAGLDYWKYLDFYVYEDWKDFIDKYKDNPKYFFSVKGKKIYTQVNYSPDDMLIFGSETKGLPAELLFNKELLLRLPMRSDITRSINLSNTVAVALFEALRQNSFSGMQ